MKNIALSLSSIGFSVALLAGCGSDTGSSSSTPASSSTKVNVYTSIDNCSTAADVPNCSFENGIYVLKFGAITDEQQQRSRALVDDFLARLHDDARKLYSQKRIVIGLVEDAPTLSSGSAADAFVLKLGDSMNEKNGTPKVIDAIELVYTNLGGKDETTKLTTYQKLIQVFDYYIDENSNTAAGTELLAAYNQFRKILQVQATDPSLTKHLVYNPCRYGNGQLAKGTCPAPDEKGEKDGTHQLNADLNPGAVIGLTYEFMRDSSKAEEAGELEGSDKTPFSNTGVIGEGNSDAIDRSNPAFKPLANYIRKWFLTK